jgi:multidrug efflux pump subunit AcrA (membrane-fusion protein)
MHSSPIPSILVFASLTGVAWYGHQHNWTLPKAFFGTGGVSTEVVDWCDSHSVPEADCIVCQPDLMDEPRKLTYCAYHGVMGCVLCDPSIAQTRTPVQPLASDLERAKRAISLRRPRIQNQSVATTAGTRIQFTSVEAMRKAGVDVEPVTRRRVLDTIDAASEIRYDATRVAQASPQADGIVRRVLVDLGDWVQPGQVLAVIDSTEAGRLKTELLAAIADERIRRDIVERLKPLAGEAVSGRRLQESESELQQSVAAVERAAAALGNLGISVDLGRARMLDAGQVDAYISQLGLGLASEQTTAPAEATKNWIAVLAPLEGQIVDRVATIGQVVDRGTELFRIVDTRAVWLDLRVPEEEAYLVQMGQVATFVPDGQGRQHRGNIFWISSDVDPTTRTVRVRAVLDNADHSLRNESFGRGQIVLRDEADAIVVPQQAVQSDGTGQIAFVRDARFFEEDRPKFFVTRSVRTGVSQDGFVEIIAGVLPGEVVATSGSEVLRAQLLRSNLGAGCTCEH